jgi:type III pantothenate kinase
MILQIDRGNTRLKWRLRNGPEDIARGVISNIEGYQSLVGEWRQYSIEQIFVASVLGEEADLAFAAWAVEQLGINPRFARAELRCVGVTNGYRTPEVLGADRWLAMLAGYARTQGACVVADCGSAITVDLVDQNGMHQGGYIAPGVAAMHNALFTNTQGVKTAKALESADLLPGKNTASAVSAAQLVMITGLIRQAMQQVTITEDSSEPPMLIMTGGDGVLLSKYFDKALYVPDLVLEGLELALAAD